MKLVKARFEKTEFGGQMVETVKALDFYLEKKSHTSQWQELLFEAFIQKHRIFGNSGEEPEIPTPEEMERLERMWAMMAGLQEKSFTPLLESR